MDLVHFSLKTKEKAEKNPVNQLMMFYYIFMLYIKMPGKNGNQLSDD